MDSNSAIQNLTSRERLLRTIRGEKVDRVPIMPFDTFEASKLIEGSEDLVFATGIKLEDFTNGWKRRDSRYRDVVRFAMERGCDVIHRMSFLEFDRRFLLIPQEFIEFQDIKVNEGVTRRKYTLRTPRGPLSYVEELKKDFSSTWVKSPLLNNRDDVEKILSVPYRFRESDIKNFSEIVDELGERGVTCCFVSTPLVCVSHMFSFDTFLMWCITEKDLIRRLVDLAFERIYRQLEYLLGKGVGPLIEFGGSEQATPPMMSPQLYDELVVGYDGKLIDLVRSHGRYVRVHCHGKIRTVLGKLLKMGVDLLNPMEGPPSGDIELFEAKELTKGKMTLEGNIQFSVLEFDSEKEIDRLVKRAVEKGGKERFILTATEWPLTYLSETMRNNYFQFIESGLKYGWFD
jgi:uroporphyrinogen-III decarboxylase